MSHDDLIGAARAIVNEGLPPDTLARYWQAKLDALPQGCHALRGGCAHVEFLLKAKRDLLALLQSDDPALQDQLMPIGQHAAQQLQSMLKQVQQQHLHRVQRRPYADELCGRPPFRDHLHDALEIVDSSELSRPSRLGIRYGWAQVEPFTRLDLPEAERAALYRRWLEPRRLKGCDMWLPNEQALVGQWGVFAATAIPAGTCVGVYGGQLMDHHDIVLLDDDRYLMTAATDMAQAASVSINGENLMSLSNTLLLLDAQGGIAGHPPDGYNLDATKFDVRLSHGWEASISAFFTLRDIAPGEELRWHYGLAHVRVTGDGAAAVELAAA